MTLLSSSIAILSAAFVATSALAEESVLSPQIFSSTPPTRIGELIEQVKKGRRAEEVERAIQELSSIDAAAPYLRDNLVPPLGSRDYRRDFTAILSQIERRASIRNRARFVHWVESGRFDLCAELLIECKEEKLAFALADLTLSGRKRIAKDWSAIVSVSTSGPLFGPRFDESFTYRQASGGEIDVDFPTWQSVGTLIRADRCDVRVFWKPNWFVVARNSLREKLQPVQGNGKWEDSIIIVNNDAEFPRVNGCLIICDGNISLSPGVQNSIIISNGEIISSKGDGGELSLLGAAGSISLPKRKEIGTSYFYSGSTVKFAQPHKKSSRIQENQKVLPLGVKFLDPREFGLELMAQNGGVQVMGIASESVFAKFGVEDGDVFLKIDSVDATTIPIFRRALRQGVVRESVVLRIRRDNKEITRIVFLDGIPNPVAPMPREVRQ